MQLFIRECYPELYDDIVDSLKTKKRGAVIGTAGIGKSTFFLYFLYRYLRDVGPENDRSFYYQVEQGKVSLYRHHTDGNNYSMWSNVSDLNPKIPLFVDMNCSSPPVEHLGVAIIFSSFRADRYKEYCKNGWIKVMPTWKYDEFSEYTGTSQFWANHQLNPADDMENVRAAYEMYGGSLRYVMECVSDVKKGKSATCIIDAAIADKGRDIARDFFVIGFGGPNTSISDVLIHRNPLLDDDGRIQYDGKNMVLNYNFASPYVFHRIKALDPEAIVTAARQKYNVHYA